MAKFHIGRSGKPALCSAKRGNCPFGSADEHYNSREAAQKVVEDRLAKQSGILKAQKKRIENESYSKKDNLGYNNNLSIIDNMDYSLEDKEFYDKHNTIRDKDYYSYSKLISSKTANPKLRELNEKLESLEKDKGIIQKEIDKYPEGSDNSKDEKYLQLLGRRDFLNREIERVGFDKNLYQNIKSSLPIASGSSKHIRDLTVEKIEQEAYTIYQDDNNFISERKSLYNGKLEKASELIEKQRSDIATLRNEYEETDTPQVKIMQKYLSQMGKSRNDIQLGLETINNYENMVKSDNYNAVSAKEKAWGYRPPSITNIFSNGALKSGKVNDEKKYYDENHIVRNSDYYSDDKVNDRLYNFNKEQENHLESLRDRHKELNEEERNLSKLSDNDRIKQEAIINRKKELLRYEEDHTIIDHNAEKAISQSRDWVSRAKNGKIYTKKNIDDYGSNAYYKNQVIKRLQESAKEKIITLDNSIKSIEKDIETLDYRYNENDTNQSRALRSRIRELEESKKFFNDGMVRIGKYLS